VALAVNATAVAPNRGGHLRLFPWGGDSSGTSTINFSAGRTRANNAVLALGVAGKVAAAAELSGPAGGTVHFVLDVSGYFR